MKSAECYLLFNGQYAGMLILGLKAKFRDLGLGIVRPWPWVYGVECSGLDTNHKAICPGITIYNAMLNCGSALNSNISVAKYLSTIVIIIILLQFFWWIAKMTQNRQTGLTVAFIRKFTFAFSALALGLWPWPCMSPALTLALALTSALTLLTSLSICGLNLHHHMIIWPNNDSIVYNIHTVPVRHLPVWPRQNRSMPRNPRRTE